MLLTSLLLLVTGTLAGSACPAPNRFCVYGTSDGKGNAIITVHSSAQGWAALGSGTSMASARYIIGWKNGNSYTISDRMSTSRTAPTVDTTTSRLVDLAVPAPSWANIAYSVAKPEGGSFRISTAGANYIWAISDSVPNSGTLNFHDDYGSAGVIDLATRVAGPSNSPPPPGTPSAPGSPSAPVSPSNPSNGGGSSNGTTSTQTPGSSGNNNGTTTTPEEIPESPIDEPTDNDSPIFELPEGIKYKSVIKYHGFVMIFAWILSPFIGIFLARFMKDRLGHRWFPLHVTFMFVGVFLGSLVGIGYIFFYKSGPKLAFLSAPFAHVHQFLGFLITIVLVLQMILGYVCDKMFDVDRTSIPVIDRVHAWAGRFMAVAALINILLGILAYKDFLGELDIPLIATAISCLVLGITAMILGEVYLQKSVHISGSAKANSKF